MKTPHLSANTVYAALALACAIPAAEAQQVPNIGDALRQSQPPPVPPPATPALPPIGGLVPQGPMLALPGGQMQVQVTQFAVLGNRVIDTPTLLALVRPEQGKRLSLADLEAIATRITRHYRSKGYFVARAYVPAQQVDGGTVTLRVVEGNYGQFHLQNQSLVRDDIVQAMLDDIKDRDIVSLDTLERAMLIINDTPGARITRADVMPGAKVGTSDFAVDAQATPAYDGFAMLDNFGSRYTGKNRLSFNLDANSPSGRGDRLSLSGLASNDGDLLNGRLAYSASLAPNGLRGEVAASRTQYQLGDAYSNLDASGTAKAIDATLTYPVRRISAQTIEAGFNLNYKDLKDEIGSTGTSVPKSLASVTALLSLRDESTWLGCFGLTQASLNLSAGRVTIDEDAARAGDAAGPQTEGSYRKLLAAASRASSLSQAFVLTASLRYQHAFSGKNLEGSERMAVSGLGAVMAYPSGELSGSNAALARLELSRPLPQWQKLHSSWLLFADWGRASAATPVGAADQSRKISDAGLGWSATYAGALLKVYVARRLDSVAASSEPTARNKVLLQGGWVF
ncbi:hemolysin activation/secretion protein [Oxalobacteraceae bacterium GrIS 1.11]